MSEKPTKNKTTSAQVSVLQTKYVLDK